jgi:hypothetical protein
MSAYKFSILEKVAAMKAIASVAKSVQEAKPDDSISDVIAAIELAILLKLNRLSQKKFVELKPAQVLMLNALRVAKNVMGDVFEFLGDEETTRQLDASERDAIASLKAKRSATAKASAAKRKAAATKDAPAGAAKPVKAAKTVDAGQKALAV